MEDRIIQWASELQSMAQAGLYYSENPFDRERYQRIREIAAEMLAERTGLPLEKVTDLFCGGVGYQTPKVDTRGAVFQDGRILLVRERDGRWAIPGGWCEYNLSPADNTVKELKEEAGVDAAVRSLIAVQDRDKHNQPPLPLRGGEDLLPLRGHGRGLCTQRGDHRAGLLSGGRPAAPGRREVYGGAGADVLSGVPGPGLVREV